MELEKSNVDATIQPAAMPAYSLHLFAGAGGGMLADLIDGITPVAAVEIEPFPRRILAKRFPGIGIWDDVRTFRADNPECADAFAWFREHADELVIAGGFPCQDISAAGRGAGIDGERSGLWREFARIVREIRPWFVFVENSPMLVSRGLGVVLGDLAALGYDAEWGVLGADAVGARHERKRMWITAKLADAFAPRLPRRPDNAARGREPDAAAEPQRRGSVPDADRQRPNFCGTVRYV